MRLLIYTSLLLLFLKAFAAEEVASNPPPVRITNSVPGIRVRNGFRVELVASDSAVSAPAAMAFDENGRLFVAEMRDYPDRREQSPHLGRIRLLEDTDGDGVFETSTVFADNLPLPSAVACYDGGIFVAAMPDILYLKDVNGDGVADERRTVFSGFGSDSTTINPDSLINNFNWGPDNRIHGGASGVESSITVAEGNSSEPISLGRNNFAFDPRSLVISPEAGSAQTGLTFDNQGRKFFCDFTHPLRQAVLQPEYFNRNPYFVVARDAVDIDSPTTPIFRFTAINSSGVPNSTARGRTATSSTLQSHALYTRARGCVIYRGNAYPSNFVGNAFIADSEAHCIHRAILRDNGITMAATRAPEEQGTEFLLSTDASFRPVQIVNAPDGALYVADFRDGGDTGRILRIVPDNFKQPKAPHLSQAKTYDLAAALAHANGWHRDTAARMLCEKKDPTTLGLLTNMVNNARNPLARLHALATLQSFGGLNEPVVLKALRDSDPAVRERALLLSEKLATDGLISDSLWNQLRFMADDTFPRVRYQLALTLGQIRHEGRPQLLVQMLQRGDIVMQNAVFSSLAEGAGECFMALAEDGSTRTTPAGLDLLRRLALMIGTQGSANDVSRVLDWLDRATSDEWDQWSQWPNLRPRWALWPQDTLTITTALGEGLRRTGSSLALVDPGRRLNRIYIQAQFISTSRVSESLRVDAIRAIGVSPYTLDELLDWPSLFLASGESDYVQIAAISAIGAHNEPRVIPTLLSRWSVFSAPLRRQVVAELFERTDRLDTLLTSLETGRISPSDLSLYQINVLRTHSNQTIRQRALQIFGQLTPQRPTAIQNFRPALRLAGDPNHGRDLFQARCANCHRTGDSGRTIGRDLTDLRALSKENLLSATVQPSAGLSPKYLTYVIESKNGQLWTGLLNHQTSRSVTLITPNNDETVLPRVNIQSIQPQPWSVMPDTLDQGLTPQTMADLLQYILSPVR